MGPAVLMGWAGLDGCFDFEIRAYVESKNSKLKAVCFKLAAGYYFKAASLNVKSSFKIIKYYFLFDECNEFNNPQFPNLKIQKLIVVIIRLIPISSAHVYPTPNKKKKT